MESYLIVLGVSVAFVAYTYFGYPGLLWLVSRTRRTWSPPAPPQTWPRISITLCAYNEEATIRGTIESLLALDYPEDRRQILIVSDASSDRTDEIVQEYSNRGVELFRVPQRSGKTEAENAARGSLTGEIVVNTDASIRIHPPAIKALVACFGDPTVGTASGRDVSVARADEASSNIGEKGYVGYEMWVRALETRVSGIVGASGCLYATRKEFHIRKVSGSYTRDFTAVAFAREAGFRSVSVDGALCQVPRQSSLRKEYRRKTRTMSRGLKTVWYRRGLFNPVRYGLFSWMLFSHKVCRWLVPVAMMVGAIAVGMIATVDARAVPILIATAIVVALAGVGMAWPEDREVPKPLSVPAYLLIANVAALNAWVNLFTGKSSASWAPTRRSAAQAEASNGIA